MFLIRNPSQRFLLFLNNVIYIARKDGPRGGGQVPPPLAKNNIKNINIEISQSSIDY